MQLRFLQFSFRDAKHMKTGGRYTACFYLIVSCKTTFRIEKTLILLEYLT